ncbi:MAG: SDR family NAD(P)-dependent oxidoreductase [Candidatus Binatia bacterium]|nr:SDR family NAD(P)-dependent oxidoreductase [Candidatus Binatia bacterium]
MSTYGPETTTNQVLDGVDLAGRRFVITGASSGLGEEATRALASKGATISMLARSREKMEAAAARIRESVPAAKLEIHEVDLADIASIRAFTDAYLEGHDAIDVLINNAGVMCCPLSRTADGFEMQFGTNHLGHFVLTNRLLPAILRGNAPRIVNLSSGGHSICNVDLDDPNFESTEYDPWESYGRSKTANVLFTVELAKRLRGEGVLSFAVHPGAIMTELGRHLTEETLNMMMERTKSRAKAAGEESSGGGMPFKQVEAGAATQVWAATAPELAAHSGSYLGDCQLGVEGGNPTYRGYASYALDAAAAEKLWAVSERLVGETFAAGSGPR